MVKERQRGLNEQKVGEGGTQGVILVLIVYHKISLIAEEIMQVFLLLRALTMLAHCNGAIQ